MCPRPLSKKSKLSISLDQQFEIFYSLFLLSVQVTNYINIMNLRCWVLAFISYGAFLKKKKRSLLATFLAWFFNKRIFHFIFFRLTKFHNIFRLLLLLEILQYIYVKIFQCPKYNKFMTSRTSMFTYATFPEVLIPLSGQIIIMGEVSPEM